MPTVNIYSFYDSSTSDHLAGASATNKLYYNETTGKISGHSASGYQTKPGVHDFIITNVRKMLKK
jgi:hypothetical protein